MKKIFAVLMLSCGAQHGGEITGPEPVCPEECKQYVPTDWDLTHRWQVCTRWYSYKYWDGTKIKEFWACGEWAK